MNAQGTRRGARDPAAATDDDGRRRAAPRRTEPTQARARFTVEAILGAAEDILRGQGVAALTTRSVAARAGVSIGAVYQYFPNKEAILERLSRRIMDEESVAASPELFRLNRQSLDDMLQGLFQHTVRTETRLLGLGQDFYRRQARHMQFGRAQGLGRGECTSEQLVRNMENVLRHHAAEVGEADTALAAFMIVRGMRVILAALVEERSDLLESPALVPMLVRMARSITDARPAPAPDQGRD